MSAPLWPRATNLAYDSTRGQVLLFGGLGATVSNDTWVWDGSYWLRKVSTALPSTREGAALADDPVHHVVVMFGGDDTGEYRRDTWLWNGTWHQACPAHTPSLRTGAAMTFDPVNHVVLLFGGADVSGGLDDTWVWNGTDWTLKRPATSPPPREYARLTFDVARGNAVLYGGSGALSDTWTWDGNNWTQRHPTRKPPVNDQAMPIPQQMVYDPVRKVVVFVDPVRHSESSADDTMDTWTWNGINWTRLAPATSPPPRDGHGLAYDSSRALVVFAGGFPSGAAAATSTWGWDGVNWHNLGPLAI